MKFTVLTLFPELFEPFREHSIIRQAILKGRIETAVLNIRDFAGGRRRVVDDRPYGGGCGMVMKPEPLLRAVRAAKKNAPDAVTILLSPQGRRFDQDMARALSKTAELILACGRYEGVDERAVHDVDMEISIGDYVLTGGELGAMVIIDAVTRLIPGVLGGAESAEKDSFSSGLLEHAQYTRPPAFEDMRVPEVLLSGHHGEIDKWRLTSALIRTLIRRPDLLDDRALSAAERDILVEWKRNIERILSARPVCGADPLSGGE